jgi:dUTP pyrophosphatase
MNIKIKRLNKFAELPSRANKSDAGYDLHACRDMIIPPMERVVVKTGIAIEIPEGFYGRIAPRSSLAIKGMDVLAGVIDSGYRDEIGVVLINLNLPQVVFNPSKEVSAYESIFGSRNKLSISAGDRIAQLIIEKCHDVDWVQEELSGSERGEGGFGSSGV